MVGHEEPGKDLLAMISKFDSPSYSGTDAPEKRLYTIKEFCVVAGLGPTTIYKLLSEGTLKAVKIGSLTRIRREDLEDWLAGLQPRIA